MANNVGKNVKEFREFLGISRAQLAERVGHGWSELKIMDLESEAELDFEELNLVSRALRTSPDELTKRNSNSKMKYYLFGSILVPLMILIFSFTTAIFVGKSLILKTGTIKSFTNNWVGKGLYLNSFSITQYETSFSRRYGRGLFNQSYFDIDRLLSHPSAIRNTKNPEIYTYNVGNNNTENLSVECYILPKDEVKLDKINANIPYFNLKFSNDKMVTTNIFVDVLFYVLKEKIPFFIPFISLLLSGFLIIYGISEPIRTSNYFRKIISKTQLNIICSISLALNMILLFCNH